MLIDCHVHVYPCFDIRVLLDAAFANFGKVAVQLANGQPFLGVLLLAESRGVNVFSELATLADAKQGMLLDVGNPWAVNRTLDPDGLYATRRDGGRLLLVAGRQVVSAEGLEVLGLFTTASFTCGTPAVELTEQIGQAGGITVLPWGVGKWIGRRGWLVQQLMRLGSPSLLLGDNGGRPWFWPAPRLFREAAGMHLRILPGTDPLPIPGEELRVGSFGYALDSRISESAPTADIRRLLCNTGVAGRPYGPQERALRFFRNQIRLRMQKGPRVVPATEGHNNNA